MRRESKRSALTQELINISIAGRDYQIRAIRAVLEGIEHKKRDFLLVMATLKEHLPHEPRWPNVYEKLIAKDRRIYISTYPTKLEFASIGDGIHLNIAGGDI